MRKWRGARTDAGGCGARRGALLGAVWGIGHTLALVAVGLVLIAAGALVPADARLFAANDLSVDESALTGESVPVGKTTKVIGDPDVPLADRTNMVYRGTLVTGGSGTALVVATGRATQVGQLQQMVGEVERPETPMQKQLRDLGERTMVIAGVVCGGVFLLGLLRGQAMGAMIRTAVSLAVVPATSRAARRCGSADQLASRMTDSPSSSAVRARPSSAS